MNKWLNEVEGKVSQNTTSFIGVNETTCIDLLIAIRTPPHNANNDRAQGG